MGKNELISQSHDGTLILGWKGEKLVNNYDFYSAFNSPEEYKLYAEGMHLGSMPLLFPPSEDMFLIFAGRLWQVINIDDDRLIIFLKPAKSGKPPKFFGTGALVSDEIRQEMFSVFNNGSLPKYLDPTAIKLFSEGCQFFSEMNLARNRIINVGKRSIIFPWSGDSIMFTIHLLLFQFGCKVEYDGLTLTVIDENLQEVRSVLSSILKNFPSDPIPLIQKFNKNIFEKHDPFVGSELLELEFAAKNIDLQGARLSISKILE